MIAMRARLQRPGCFVMGLSPQTCACAMCGATENRDSFEEQQLLCLKAELEAQANEDVPIWSDVLHLEGQRSDRPTNKRKRAMCHYNLLSILRSNVGTMDMKLCPAALLSTPSCTPTGKHGCGMKVEPSGTNHCDKSSSPIANMVIHEKV
jgi:hypothetical protein